MSQKINSSTSLKKLGASLIFVLLAVITTSAQVNNLVISQVYGGGGNSGASYRNDFIEIFNPTSGSISLSGYSLQQTSAGGTGAWTVAVLSGSIASGKYYLIQGASGGAVGTLLPTADATSTINMAVGSGKIALCNSTTALSGGAPTSASIVDLFGWGASATAFEGAFGPVHTNTTSVSRINGGCTDVGNNSTDFVAGTVNPRNSASAANYCSPSALSFLTISSPQTQGVAFSVTVKAVDLNGTQKNATSNTLVTLTTNGNAGTLSGSTTGTITTGASSVVITGVILSGSGTGVTLTATATSGMSLTTGTSNGFNVSSAAANDCAGVPGGTALPGTSCDDANACTINDVWSASCVCAGTVQDTDGDGTCDATDDCDNDPNKILAGTCGCGNVEVGQSCNDNNACTLNDVVTSCGVCAGTPALDTDNDGTCDLTDECDNDPTKILAGACGCGNAEPTTACDDSNPLTTNDAINGSCVCVGLYPSIYYDFATAAFTTNTISNLAATSVVRGNNNGTTNGLLNTSVASSGYSGASAGNNAGAAARIGVLDLTPSSGSAYFEFTLDADLNYAFTMTEIALGTRSTGTGPQSIALRSSADGYIADLATVTVLANSVWTKKSLVLTNFTTIPGANVTYRLYGYGGSGSAAINTSNWRIDDLNIFGFTTFTPPVSIVQFSDPTQSGTETLLSDTLMITMDIAPQANVVITVSDLLTGSAAQGSDYNYSTSTVTFTPAETYPSNKFIFFGIVNDTDVEPTETIVFGAAITSGTATLGTAILTYSLSSDDLAQLVINEVDYDNVGTDNAEWIEIKNNGATAVDINGYKLELVNGGNTPATVYTTLTLASTTTLIQPGGYFVVGNNAAIANINLVVTPTSNLIQNGAPDAIALKDNSNNLLDAVSYEGNTAGVYTEGASLNTLQDAGINLQSIGRYPDGADSGDNMVDLITLCESSPGAANVPGTSSFYQDLDGDTFGNPDSILVACLAPVGYVLDNTDCLDSIFSSNINGDEICDGLDNNCNLTVDEGLSFVNYGQDADTDGSGYAPVAYYNSIASEGVIASEMEIPAQTFTTGTSSVIGVTVVLPLGTCKLNGLTGAQLDIVTVDGVGAPEVNNVLGTYQVPASSIVGTPGCAGTIYADVAFYFNNLTLQANTMYGLVLRKFEGAGGASVSWKRSSTPTDVSNPYPSGTVWTSMSFGSNLNMMSNDNLDLNFQVYELSKHGLACTAPSSNFVVLDFANLDCNNSNTNVSPLAQEVCDGVDNDCSGTADNGLIFTDYYNDADGDTYGAGTATNACQSPGATYVTNNTDCDDAASSINPGASEICDGLDNDCTGGADNGLTFTNYYNDADGDTYGAGTATNACQSPGATYVTNNTDCNDAAVTAFPGGTEVCGNSMDEDCSGADLACPQGSFSTAIAVANIGQFGTGSQSTQTVNLSTGTNTVQSPGLGLDKWFSFTASSNAMRIAVVGSSSVADDNDLSLYETPTDPTVQLIPIVSENDVHPGSTGAAADGGSETLIFDQLIVGDVYYLCVRNNNNTAGNVSLTLSNLNPSTTDIALYTNGTNTFTSACQNFKVKFRPNSGGYTINRWNSADISGTPSWSYAIPVTSTVASTICQLGKIAPANLSGSAQTIYVTVDVLYNLTDAFGTVTPATARGIAAASFQMANEADLSVRASDRCAAGFKMVSSSIATSRSVCGTSRYVWEMTMAYPLASLPLEVQGPVGGSRILMLNAVSGISNGQRYDVRIGSKHIDGISQSAYGTTQCVKTIGAAGMPTIEEEVNMYERSENGITTTIYPNPNNGQTVNFSINGMDGSLNLKVTDATGRGVYNNRFMVEGAMNTTLDFGQTLADGVYMVEMIQNGEMKTMRMVVSK